MLGANVIGGLVGNVIASIVQGAIPQYCVQMFFTSAAFLMMVFGVQSPEERMHGTTGLFSINAYVQDINKYSLYFIAGDIRLLFYWD